ncbi:MAG TPA: tetratricopeptide repeat protein [Chthonomonadaceae bacterium]|nr:tetratricopeptide repeat protein [Chthonomonadaceae bacterium]
MRILGPDGRPIETGPPVSEEIRKMVENARALADQGHLQPALQQMAIAFQGDVASDLVLDTTCALLARMAQITGAEENPEQELFEKLRQNRDDPAAYYQTGEHFFQLQQPSVARAFLARAKELKGDIVDELSQAIDVNYAQALMDMGDYEGAIAAFHALNDKYGGLPIWLILEMAECYALLRRLDEAEAVYQVAPPEAAAQFEGMEAVREEVGDLLARVHDFDGEDMDLRDWYYVQTRSVLLETNPDENSGGRFDFFQPTEEEAAYLIGIAAALLDIKGYAPNRILWLGEHSEPLARAFAQWWEVRDEDVRAYRPGDNTDSQEELSLLVMNHSYDVFALPDQEAFVDLAQARAGLITFALDMRWAERQPMVPDLAGFLSQACNLPWEPRVQIDPAQQTITPIEETRDAQTVAADLARQFPSEAECDQVARDILEDLSICTDLILDHRDGELIRRPMVTHSPIQPSQPG